MASRTPGWRSRGSCRAGVVRDCHRHTAVAGQQGVDVGVGLDGRLVSLWQHPSRVRSGVRPIEARGGSTPASPLLTGRALRRSRACSSPPRSAGPAPGAAPWAVSRCAASPTQLLAIERLVPGRHPTTRNRAPARAATRDDAEHGGARSRGRCGRSGRARPGSCCPAAAACSRKRGRPASARRKTCAVTSSAACVSRSS